MTMHEMTLWIQSNEAFLRIGTFVTIFGAMALAEILAPRRNQSAALRRSRWPSNLMLLVLDTLLVRVVLPAGALGIAALCVTNGIGFFNIVSAPAIVGVLISLLGLDFLIYGRADRWLRFLVVTPDMHRIHHSTRGDEMTSNFGFNLPWWDRIFRTYREAPALPHETMNIGVCGIQQRNQTLSWMITTPFQENLSAPWEEENEMNEGLLSH